MYDQCNDRNQIELEARIPKITERVQLKKLPILEICKNRLQLCTGPTHVQRVYKIQSQRYDPQQQNNNYQL